MIAFVIMPILKEGTDRHKHFLSLYNFMRTTLVEAGYECVRADEIQKSGAITQDIIKKLAEADLVVAELADLNPNVFYELGVRHALRAHGTILTLDETITAEIPFDLQAYRVIKYGSSLTEIDRLTRGLKSALQSLDSTLADGAVKRDNPVHDWLPALPENALDAATGSTEGVLRAEVAGLKKSLAEYKRRFGALDVIEGEPDSLREIEELLARARAGELGPDLIDAAQRAAQLQDSTSFLEVVAKVLRDTSLRLSSKDYLRLALWAGSLGLDTAAKFILRDARAKHPTEEGVELAYWGNLAHSYDPEDRVLARRSIERRLGIAEDVDGSPVLTTDFKADRRLFGLLMDVYQEDSLYDHEFRLVSAVLETHASEEWAIRNFARALEHKGDDRALDWYRLAAVVPDATDVSAMWLGNECHNRQRHLDALEAYSLGCSRDPNDAHNWARMLGELVQYMEAVIDGPESESRDMSVFTDDLSETVDTLTLCFVSCENIPAEDLQSVLRNIASLGVKVSWLTSINELRAGAVLDVGGEQVRRLRVHERRTIAKALYGKLRSDLTDSASASLPRSPQEG